MLLSLSPAGPEFRVNSYTTDVQDVAAAGMDGDGDFVLAWQSSGQDGSSNGVYAQRYNAAGVPQGGEFRVNSTTAGSQGDPSIAVDADGDFVVAWTGGSTNPDIFAQRYNSAGVAQGGEFRVNTFTTSSQTSSAIAMDVAGDFVIAWQSTDDIFGPSDVHAQRYNYAGVAQGGEFRVNTTTTDIQFNPSVAMDASGDFVAAWASLNQDGSGYGVYAQRYNSVGLPQGGEFLVNTYTTSNQVGSVAMDADGDFVVAWSSFGQEGGFDFGGIYAQRYNSSGVAQGGEFHVNTFTTSTQADASIAMDAAGDFVVAWSSLFQDGDGYGVYSQAYSAAGVAQGSEFHVSTFTTGPQRVPTVAMDHAGDVVVAWWSNGQDGSDYGVYAQRYHESTDTAGAMVAGVFVNGQRVLPYSTLSTGPQQIVVSFSESVVNATNPANWLLTRNGADITADITSVTFGFNATTNRHEAMLNLSTSYTSGNFLVLARDSIQDLAGNNLDGNFDGAPGGSFALPFSVALAQPVGGEFRVNTFTTGFQGTQTIAQDATGNFVVTWNSANQDGSGYGIYARLYNAAGAPQSAEFRCNTFTTNSQVFPAVAMDADGDFVVAWQSYLQDGSLYGIYAQRFNALGVAQGSEFRANTTTASHQKAPRVAMDANGDFVIAWESYAQDGSSYGVYAKRYNASGVAQGAQFRANTYTTGPQSQVAVAMDTGGDFIVAWTSYQQDGSNGGVYAQRYSAAGLPQGSEFRVNSNTPNKQAYASAAMDADGDFVIAWESSGQDGSLYGIYSQRYDAAGIAQGGEFRVNTYTTNSQVFPSVAMDSRGDFVVTWGSLGQDGSGSGVYAQRYGATGIAQGAEFRVNTFTTSGQFSSSVAMDRDGDFVIAWGSDQDGSGYGVYAQRYVVDRTPTVGSLADSPDPVASGDTFTLSASNVTDDGTVTSVSFYRESNGVVGLQVGAEGDTLVGTDTTPSAGVWSADVSTTGLAAGNYTYWAQATDDIGLIGTPASTTNQVQSSFPLILAPHRLLFAFNANVSASLGTEDIVLQNLTTMQTIPSNQLSLSYDLQTNVATFTYIGPGEAIAGVLPDGNYRATLLAAGITDPDGVPLPANIVFDFFFLNGDANHDGRVNVNDFTILAGNFNQSNRIFSQGDFNYDGMVNTNDFTILASRFGTVLAADGSIQNTGERLGAIGSPFGTKGISDAASSDDLHFLLDGSAPAF